MVSHQTHSGSWLLQGAEADAEAAAKPSLEEAVLAAKAESKAAAALYGGATDTRTAAMVSSDQVAHTKHVKRTDNAGLIETVVLSSSLHAFYMLSGRCNEQFLSNVVKAYLQNASPLKQHMQTHSVQSQLVPSTLCCLPNSVSFVETAPMTIVAATRVLATLNMGTSCNNTLRLLLATAVLAVDSLRCTFEQSLHLLVRYTHVNRAFNN